MQTPFMIRPATPADGPAVDALLQASYPELMRAAYEPAVLAPALSHMTRANPALLASGTFYLASSAAGSIIGCGGWTAVRPGTGEREGGLAHIRHFATHPAWAGKGVGRALFERCAAEAAAAGLHAFECFASLNAEAFYAALGLQRVRRMDLELAPGVRFPVIRMRGGLPAC